MSAFLRFVISSSETDLPAAINVASALSVMLQIFLHATGITGFATSARTEVSTIIATEPESVKIQSICSALEVS